MGNILAIIGLIILFGIIIVNQIMMHREKKKCRT